MLDAKFVTDGRRNNSGIILDNKILKKYQEQYCWSDHVKQLKSVHYIESKKTKTAKSIIFL